MYKEVAMQEHTKKRISTILAIVSLSSLLCLGGGLIYMYRIVSVFDTVFANNIYVEHLPLEGLTKEEGYQLVKEQCDTYNATQFIELTHEQQNVRIPLTELNPTYNIDAVLTEAFKKGHEGNLFSRYRTAQHGLEEPAYFDVTPKYTHVTIQQVLLTYAPTFYTAPVDATIKRESRSFVITPEVSGEALDCLATGDKIYTTLLGGSPTTQAIEIVLQPVKSQITAESLKTIQAPIASFYTAYNDTDSNRNQNLILAAEKINCVLLPGEVFSLGEQLEPITAEAGYFNSKVILNGKLEEGIGGGVCQIASTLYNAVLLSNLDITMRANHSLPVAYVPLGRDATYATGSIDFQFQNNSDYPLFIESYCENNRVYVNLFSDSSLKPSYDEIKFTSETVETIDPPPTEYIKDPTMEMGKMVTEVTPLTGKTIKLYKLYYKDDELVNKERVNTSYYRARGEVVRIGTKVKALEYNY